MHALSAGLLGLTLFGCDVRVCLDSGASTPRPGPQASATTGRRGFNRPTTGQSMPVAVAASGPPPRPLGDLAAVDGRV
jgi:hypothetical protein